MMCRKLIRRTVAVAAAAVFAISTPLSPLENFAASAAGSKVYSLPNTYEGQKGTYRYHFEGKLTNPCNESSLAKKSNVIGEFWFEFSYIEDNGTGESKTERFDMSYSDGTNNNMDFLKTNFIRPDDDETDLSFDMIIPGQLTDMKIHLEMNGTLSLFSYERMSFDITHVTANGFTVNTSTDDVSSSVGSSDAQISFLMDKPDGSMIAAALDEEEITMKQIIKMIENRETDKKNITDKYGALITDQAILSLTEKYGGDINQLFSHSDEPGMYFYTLRMNIDNPVNISNSDAHKIERFIIDFTYNDSEHYELDLSWDEAEKRCRNQALAELFCRPDDNETTAEMNVWIPGRVSKINVVLNMSGGERLSVSFEDILIGGLKMNRSTDYVSSIMFESKAEIVCTVPDSLINLSALSDERIGEVLEAIYNQDEKADLSDVRDQLGSLIGKKQIKAAHDEMMKCINAPDNDTRAEYADVITGFYMYRTVYHAQSISALQSFIEEKRIEAHTTAAS